MLPRGCFNDALRILLQRRARTNLADKTGQTELHLVCSEVPDGALETVDLLLKAGSSETEVDHVGNTPLDLVREAAEWADDQIVQRICVLLRRAPADRAWRRRGWLVLLRARTERERRAHSVDHTGSDSGDTENGGRRVLGGGQGGGGSSDKRGKTEGGGGAEDGGAGGAAGVGEKEVVGDVWSDLVAGVVGLEAEGLFRRIVGYL